MVANIRGYTPNYSFKLINFDTPRWHTLEYSNWNMVDAMFLQGGIPQVRGGWQNNTLYLEGDRAFDEETSATYRCLIEHTSPELGTFGEFRLLNPTYWSLQLAGTPVYRGKWLPGVTYVLGDIVYVTDYDYYLCTMANVSSGTFAADAMKWQTIFDATQVVTDAEDAKAAAYQFSLDAQGSANDAASSATDAQTAEDDAEDWANDARAASGSFRWAYTSDTAAIDPAVGRLAFNTTDPLTVTEIYLSAFSSEAGNPDVSAWVETWDDSTNPNTRGTLQVRKVGAPEQFLIFNLVNPITDNGTWLRLPVAYVSHSGSLTNGEPLSVGFVRAGNVGPTGTGGGDMLKANNLNDVANVPTARTNLGLGTAQVPTFSQVSLDAAVTAAKHAATKEYVDSSPSLYISDTQPPVATTLAGSLWWDSDKGTLFVLYDDASGTPSKQWVQAVAVPGVDLSSVVKKAGDAMHGNLVLSYADPTLYLTKTAGTNVAQLFVTTNAVPRWLWRFSDIGAEGGANVGADFALYRYNDAGTIIDAPIRVTRVDGRLQILDPTAANHAATKAYVDSVPGAVVRHQLFVASGTYTPHTDMVTATVEVCGGGGAGGGSTGAGSASFVGGGGGGGGYCRKYLSRANIGASQVVTIGAGGAASFGTGGNGGTTSFGAFCTAAGGVGGLAGSSPSLPTSGGGGGEGVGDFGFNGAPGQGGVYSQTSTQYWGCGHGGASYFGKGCLPGTAWGSIASSGQGGPEYGYGGGGGGGATHNTGAGAVGGPGCPGVVIVTEYCRK